MKRIILIVTFFSSINVYAQKTISCKKGNVKQSDQVIANYDGVGGFRKLRMGVFAPNSKDTLIRITEETYNPKNPLFIKMDAVFKIEFKNTTLAPFYITKEKWGYPRLTQRDVIEMLFNDSVPLLIASGKIDEKGVEEYRNKKSFSFEYKLNFAKEVEDSIAIINAPLANRDVSKPIILKIVTDNSTTVNVNQTTMRDVDQIFEIYQGDVLLGRLLKKVTSGEFPEATYTVWKSITPVIIKGIHMKYSPVAVCTTGSIAYEIIIYTVIGKKEFRVKGNFNQLENNIANVVVSNKYL